ncbi:MAG: acetate--CoA ligase family protein, partial [Planctomycetota bacterium]|nr:acetate--CoA ligase family protein [Planctomycetota bacterium]
AKRKTQNIIGRQGKIFTTDDALSVINSYGIPVPDFRIAQSLNEALEQADKIGYPIVLKIISPQISHKTDVGGIRLNLHTPAELSKAYREITEKVFSAGGGSDPTVARPSPGSRQRDRGAFGGQYLSAVTIKGVMVQKMISGGKEVIIGVSRDRQFGHLIMFGLGGIYVEILKDVSFRLAPLNESDVDAMIREIKAYPLLTGARGQESSDLQSLKETILKISQLVMDFPQITELDINPYKVFAKGGVAIDARITIS